jgi:polyisoprenoid-binding protein YceI
VIDTRSVNTGSAIFNEHIQGEDFLDTAKYPTATFKSTKVVFEGDKPAKIEGNLTLKGMTKPVTLTVTSFQAMPHPMLKKDAIGANAWTVVKRSEFNMRQVRPERRRRSDVSTSPSKPSSTLIAKSTKGDTPC